MSRSAAPMPVPPEGEARQRIDKWLWHARFVRTRTAAQKLAAGGRVRVNRDRIEAASRAVGPGDVLTIRLDGGVRVVRVRALAERRGSPADARRLYEDLSPGRPAAQPADRQRTGPEEDVASDEA